MIKITLYDIRPVSRSVGRPLSAIVFYLILQDNDKQKQTYLGNSHVRKRMKAVPTLCMCFPGMSGIR